MKVWLITILFLVISFPVLIYAQRQPNRASNFTTPNPRPLFPFRKKPSREQKKQLQPRAEDLAKHAGFLGNPKTGIFRLFPDAGCEDNPLVVKADEKCLQAIPESSQYSFREQEHTSDVLADIRLKNGFLLSDGILTQGIMVNLGDVGLEKISPASDGMLYLKNYQPQESSVEAYKQHLQMLRGVRIDKYEYRKIHSAIENSTYALRVIAYRGSIYRTFRGWRYNLLEGDKRIDLTIAFRLAGKNADGSVTILWKELDRRESPKIKFIKKDKKNER